MRFTFKHTPFFAALVLFSLTAATAIAKDFILTNKSGYDIFCRSRSIAEAEQGLWTGTMDHVIKPGDSIQLTLDRNYSIRTAGKKTMWSQYYDVPKPYELAQKTLNAQQFHEFDLAMNRRKPCIPVISISSGVTYGWNFVISYTCR